MYNYCLQGILGRILDQFPDLPNFFGSPPQRLKMEQKKSLKKEETESLTNRAIFQGSVFFNSLIVLNRCLCHLITLLNDRVVSDTFHLHLSWACYLWKHSVYNKWNYLWVAIKNETFFHILSLDRRWALEFNIMDSRCSEVSLAIPFSSQAMMEASNSLLPFLFKKATVTFITARNSLSLSLACSLVFLSLFKLTLLLILTSYLSSFETIIAYNQDSLLQTYYWQHPWQPKRHKTVSLFPVK